MNVPDLRRRVMKIFEDVKLQLRLREGCNAVLKNDAVGLLRRLHRRQRRAVKLGKGVTCGLCGRPL